MLNTLPGTWQNLPLPRKIAFVAILVAVFGGILAVSQMANRPSFAVLFANMAEKDASEVVNKLRDRKIEFRLTNGGRTIEVPAAEVLELRLNMADIPKNGTVGFEIFDKTNIFTATGEMQRLNYQRALQGELSRTIDSIDGVVSSRVHIAIPEKKLFTQEREEPSASVMVHLQPGRELEDQQVKGIVNLVASAVEGLKPAGVKVHDGQGNLLSRDAEALAGTATVQQLSLQERYERRMEAELRELAEQVLGAGKAAVRVSADFNWDQSETTSEVFKPGGPNGKNLPLEEESSTETFGKDEGALSISGAPGAPANIGTQAATGSGLGAAQKKYGSERTQSKYAVSKTVEKRVSPAGKLKRVSVAVLLDGAISAAQQTSLKNAFAAAAGLDLASIETGGRGDRLELLPMPFDRTAEAAETKAAAQQATASSRDLMIRNGAAVAVVVLMLLATAFMSRRPREPKALAKRGKRLNATITEDVTSGRAPVAGAYDAAGRPATLSPGIAEAVGARTALPSLGDDIEEPMAAAAPRIQRREEVHVLVERARAIATDRPDAVARELSLWMAE